MKIKDNSKKTNCDAVEWREAMESSFLKIFETQLGKGLCSLTWY